MIETFAKDFTIIILINKKSRYRCPELSEDVKAATSGKYQISSTIREIYKIAVKEQRALDSKTTEQEEH